MTPASMRMRNLRVTFHVAWTSTCRHEFKPLLSRRAMESRVADLLHRTAFFLPLPMWLWIQPSCSPTAPWMPRAGLEPNSTGAVSPTASQLGQNRLLTSCLGRDQQQFDHDNFLRYTPGPRPGLLRIPLNYSGQLLIGIAEAIYFWNLPFDIPRPW